MDYMVLAAWLIQASVGVTLLVSWVRRARGQDAALVIPHAIMMLVFAASWTVFIVTGAVPWAWVGFGILAAFIGFGDATMVRRARSMRGQANGGMRDYGPALRVVLAGGLGRRVAFHALFSAVVFFGCLGVAIGATVAAAG